MANFKSLFSTRPAFPKLQFEAEATDGSLSHLLSEAFAVIERRFGMLDKDGAGMMMYAALEGQLSLTGFNDNEKLRKIFQKVSSSACQYQPRASAIPRSAPCFPVALPGPPPLLATRIRERERGEKRESLSNRPAPPPRFPPPPTPSTDPSLQGRPPPALTPDLIR